MVMTHAENGKRFLVIQDHTSEFPEPITFEKGTILTIGEKYQGKEPWENWYFCTTPGQKGGWVPAQVIEDVGAKASKALESYTARELNVVKGETVWGERILNGWVWCVKPDQSASGWVPLLCLELLQPRQLP